MDFLKDIVKEIGDDFTKLASDIDETETYVDTGSYIFNALVSGSIFGGVSGNKITAIAGESSTEKIKSQLEKRKKGFGVRVGVKTTGCSGLAYVLEYADQILPGDHIFESKGVHIYVDSKSLVYLAGLS